MDEVYEYSALPTQGRAERAHLYEWMKREEEYVAAKFDDQRLGHDESLRNDGLEDFWERQILQYMDRAKLFLAEAALQRAHGGTAGARELELRAQQALAKGMMTWKGLMECSIRVYGPLPAPGVPSGDVKYWDE